MPLKPTADLVAVARAEGRALAPFNVITLEHAEAIAAAYGARQYLGSCDRVEEGIVAVVPLAQPTGPPLSPHDIAAAMVLTDRAGVFDAKAYRRFHEVTPNAYPDSNSPRIHTPPRPGGLHHPRVKPIPPSTADEMPYTLNPSI